MAKPCFECGENADVEHHVVPRSRGGKNTVPLCESCHGKAHGRQMTTKALVVDALARKKAKGERTGGVPYGYKLSEDGVHLTEDPGEQIVLSMIRQMRAAGETLRFIAAELNWVGVPTKGGKPWKHSTVQSILKMR